MQVVALVLVLTADKHSRTDVRLSTRVGGSQHVLAHAHAGQWHGKMQSLYLVVQPY